MAHSACSRARSGLPRIDPEPGSMQAAGLITCPKFPQPWFSELRGETGTSWYDEALCILVVALLVVVLIDLWVRIRTSRTASSRDSGVGTESTPVVSRGVIALTPSPRPLAVSSQHSRLPSAVYVARRYGTVYHSTEGCTNLKCSQSTTMLKLCDLCRCKAL